MAYPVMSFSSGMLGSLAQYPVMNVPSMRKGFLAVSDATYIPLLTTALLHWKIDAERWLRIQ